MRKTIAWLALAACLLCLPGAALEERPEVILYTAYRQVGWGDVVQVGLVDAQGGLWTLEGYDSELRWPYAWEEQLSFLAAAPDLTCIGRLTDEELFGLNSLIASVQESEGAPQGWMCDAGTETSRAVRYHAAGAPESVLLGVTGDDLLENRDPNAQALYLRLRQLFPCVRSYEDECGEWGFTPVPLRAFLGWEDIGLEDADIEAARIDCEAGPIPVDLSAEEKADLRELLQKGMVTGKENATLTTGGTTAYSFVDAAGVPLCSLELYKGMLVTGDGMYALSLGE